MSVARSKTYEQIYEKVKQIPKGTVATYGLVAKLSKCSGPRQVGYALHALPENQRSVPWHRVINTKGEISLPKGSEAHEMQRVILEGEGIRFESGKISLKRFLWRP